MHFIMGEVVVDVFANSTKKTHKRKSRYTKKVFIIAYPHILSN